MWTSAKTVSNKPHSQTRGIRCGMLDHHAWLIVIYSDNGLLAKKRSKLLVRTIRINHTCGRVGGAGNYVKVENTRPGGWEGDRKGTRGTAQGVVMFSLWVEVWLAHVHCTSSSNTLKILCIIVCKFSPHKRKGL